jgi:hypothetical protein
MANSLFDIGREKFLSQSTSLDWDTDTIKFVCMDHGVDTPVVTTDLALSDFAAGARIATSAALASKTVTAGVADAADVTIATVSGASFESVNFYKDSGVEATSTLILFIDTATGLPTTPNGADINFLFDNGANKIFKL